jgi:hypothetical protein
MRRCEKELMMNFALVCHDPATGRVTVHELPTIAVIEPCAATKEHREWTTEVDVRLADGSTLLDTSPGHAIMEVLGLYAEDEGIPRWRRMAEGVPVPERDETVLVHPRLADTQGAKS